MRKDIGGNCFYENEEARTAYDILANWSDEDFENAHDNYINKFDCDIDPQSSVFFDWCCENA